MLKSLFIKDFTIIDQIEISFNKGLSVLAGETGSGKSILIDAIDLVFGARASKYQIKRGKQKAFIEAQIQIKNIEVKQILEENSIETEEDGSIIISREISKSSTRSRINGIIVTQSYIQSLREFLIDIHSQHETYNYMNSKTHIDLLDNYGDKVHQELVEIFVKTYQIYSHKQKKLEKLKSEIRKKEQKIDFLNFQIEEISNANISDVNEYDELFKQREVLLNTEKLKELTYSSYSELYGKNESIIDILNQIEKRIINASELEESLSGFAQTVSSCSINLKDVADELMDYSENLEMKQESLDLIEERMDLLDKLKRKYGPTLEDIIKSLSDFETELAQIETDSQEKELLEREVGIISNEINKKVSEITTSRKNLATKLSELIQKELVKLEMPKVNFSIEIGKKNELSIKGKDEVEFLISTNLGEPLKPFAKIASGGELSRIMLAIKTIFAKADNVDTVIFDEIDTGISGKTSQAISEELASLAQTHQVLCITHQPIVAAMADEYFYIRKIQKENSTVTQIKKLDLNQKISAISKLASGSDKDKDSVNFATKLIEQADSFKKSLTKEIIIYKA